MRYLVIATLLLIVASLASALVFLQANGRLPDPDRFIGDMRAWLDKHTVGSGP